ncbi:hypothetical protein [Neisseria elongata]|jgi:hypothetical protein|uniref:hypothetical protein n=1 Tax=Neisseria elongata TaxID=495 RepID=UPI0013B37575|nr:hypothetical protein [Neisseria elongata]
MPSEDSDGISTVARLLVRLIILYNAPFVQTKRQKFITPRFYLPPQFLLAARIGTGQAAAVDHLSKASGNLSPVIPCLAHQNDF